MSITTSVAGPYYSSGTISFSSLRTNFRAQQADGTFLTDTASISASELKRSTGNVSNPIVPNATENAPISSSNSNISLEDFRNSIKFYNATQSGTDLNLDISSISWNNNLTKNIVKKLFVTGAVGSNSTSDPAAEMSTTFVKNLTISVSGTIRGASGPGGQYGVSGGNGGAGGYALDIQSNTNGYNVEVFVDSLGRVQGGGGGGGAGAQGATGNSGTCNEETTLQGCGGVSGCPGGWSQEGGTWSGNCCQTYCQWCGWSSCGCQPCSQWLRYRKCKNSYSTSGGTGGDGGDGGPGRGYDNLLGSLAGSDGGSGGSGGGCGAGSGGTGGTGGKGGKFGSPGESPENGGSGGPAGAAINGTNYTVSGSTSSPNIKGTYLST